MNAHTKDHYGSSQWATRGDLHRAGMLKPSEGSVYLARYGRTKIYAPGKGGIVTCAAPRSGKLTTQIIHNVVGPDAYEGNMIIVDPKGEIAKITANQVPHDRRCIYFNPFGLHGLPQHSIATFDYIHADSSSLITDARMMAMDKLPLSGSPSGKFFESQAQQAYSAIASQIALKDGYVTADQMHSVITGIEQPSDDYLALEYHMLRSDHSFIRRVAATFKKERNKQSSGTTGGGGTQGIQAELFNAISYLDDPVVRHAFQEPYDFSFQDMMRSGAPKYIVYLMVPADSLKPLAPAMMDILIAASMWKTRYPESNPLLLMIDEAAQFGRFPLISRLFTYKAGEGIRTWVFYQSARQMDITDTHGKEIILSSAAYQCWFAVNENHSAQELSRMIGDETRIYPDYEAYEKKRYELRKITTGLMLGDDLDTECLAKITYLRRTLNEGKTVRRPLIDPSEIQSRLGDDMIILGDGLRYPIRAQRLAYYQDKTMTGYYLPSPFYPPHDRLRIPGAIFRRWRQIITEPVPKQYANWPQYRETGQWQYVDGFRPKISNNDEGDYHDRPDTEPEETSSHTT